MLGNEWKMFWMNKKQQQQQFMSILVDIRLIFRVMANILLSMSWLREFRRKFLVSNNTKNEWENKLVYLVNNKPFSYQ